MRLKLVYIPLFCVHNFLFIFDDFLCFVKDNQQYYEMFYRLPLRSFFVNKILAKMIIMLALYCDSGSLLISLNIFSADEDSVPLRSIGLSK